MTNRKRTIRVRLAILGLLLLALSTEMVFARGAIFLAEFGSGELLKKASGSFQKDSAGDTDVDEQTIAEPILRNLPSGWAVMNSFALDKANLEGFSKTLGTKIVHLTNNFLSHDGKTIQVNVIQCETFEGAKKVETMLRMQHVGLPEAVLRNGDMIIEFANTNDKELISAAKDVIRIDEFASGGTALQPEEFAGVPKSWKLVEAYNKTEQWKPVFEEKLDASFQYAKMAQYLVDGHPDKKVRISVVEAVNEQSAAVIYAYIFGYHRDNANAYVERRDRFVIEFFSGNAKLAEQAARSFDIDEFVLAQASGSFEGDLGKIRIGQSGADDVLKIFGKPSACLDERGKEITSKHLGDKYRMMYEGFSFDIDDTKVKAIHFTIPGYQWNGVLEVGDSMEEALTVMEKPRRTERGAKETALFDSDVLYKDIEGDRGRSYYSSSRDGIEIRFLDDKVKEITVRKDEPRYSKKACARRKYSTEELIEKAKQLVRNLSKGEYRKCASGFDATMRRQLGPDKLQPAWESVIAQTGAFVEIEDVQTQRLPRHDVVLVTCKMERSKIVVKAVYDVIGRVSGLFLVPTDSQ